MCGIVGIVRFNPEESADEARLKRMRDVLRHRGPDGEGLWIDGPVGLGHRRLSIVDVAGGAQPMANEQHAESSMRALMGMARPKRSESRPEKGWGRAPMARTAEAASAAR